MHGLKLPFIIGVPLLPAAWQHLAPGADDFKQQEHLFKDSKMQGAQRC